MKSLRYLPTLAAVAAFALLSNSPQAQAAAESGSAQVAPVPEGHPRLYLSSDDVTELRKSIKKEPYRSLWKRVRSDDDYLYKALTYLVEGDKKAGRAAIEEALQEMYKPDVFPDTRHFSSAYHKAACVYDWCYPLLKENEKERFIHQFITLPNQPNKHGNIYIGYPADMDSNAATGHQSEGYLVASQIPAGIAIYDENQLLYDAAAKLFFEKFVPVRNYHYDSHTHHQGTFYGVGRFHYDANTSWLFKSLGAGDVLSEEQRFVPYYYIYMQRPDGVAFPVGDAIAGGSPQEVYAKVGSYYHDPYLLGLGTEETSGDFGKLFDLLFRDYETKPRPIVDLPLTKYFPSPSGAMVARTGWDIGPDSQDAAIFMHIGEAFFGNHQHYDFGSFQIAYRGPLAIASGYYSDFGGEHNRNYYNSAISKNTLLILDPDEAIKFQNKTVANDGGQSPQPEHESKTQPVTLMGEVTAHAFGPDEREPTYSYLAGDVSKGYSSEKASQVTRSMVAFNFKQKKYPAALVVFDRVDSTEPSFKKSWLLHSIQEPNIDGKTIHIVRAGANTGTRRVEMPEGAEFGGRLITESLLPKDATISAVGGPGKDFWIESAQKNFAPEIKERKGKAFHPGAWRVEISPATEGKSHRFLNVMTVMDIETKRGPKVELLESDGMIGARVHDQIAFFADKSPNRKSASLSLPKGGDFGVLVCDLEPGTYAVEQDGRTIARDLVATESGQNIYFEAKSGPLSVKQTKSGAPSAPEPKFWKQLRATANN